MSNNTSVSGITKPTQYTLLDNSHKYLPRDFTFIPTVSSDSNANAITKTVENALDNTYYYTCTPQDFVYKIGVNNGLENVVYSVADKSACVYKISSEGNDVYKYCEDTAKVNINVLGDALINIGNVTVTKGEDDLIPIATNLGCTVPNATKEITVPKDYSSLKINSSKVFFRQENGDTNPSWVKIIEDDGNKQVFFSNIQLKPGIYASFEDNLNWYIQLDNTKYQIHSLYIYTELGNAQTDLNNAQTDLNHAQTDLNNAQTDLNNLKTMCNGLTDNLSTDKRSYLPETITKLLTLDVSEINKNLNLAISSLNSSEQDLETTKNYLDNAIGALNNLITSIDGIKTSDKYIYVIGDSNNLVGLTTMPDELNKLWLFIDKWLEEVCSYCMDKLSTDTTNFNFNFLDTDKKMIIYKKSDNSYDLVYLENYGQNGDRILPNDDYFITTVTPTEP